MSVKVFLETAFETWGRPLCLRFDNGFPWGSNSLIPSAMALWIAGLGIQVLFGRPARSTDNAVVERSHGVLANWVEAEECADFAALQDHLDWASETQRERYRSAHHLSRAEAYPDLYTNQRGYRRQQEASLWSLAAAAAFLATYHFERKVEKNGGITLLAEAYAVGRSYARQKVYVHLDATTFEWVIQDAFGKELRRHLSQELDYTRIKNLKLAKRRKD
jgi:hypothetical protein